MIGRPARRGAPAAGADADGDGGGDGLGDVGGLPENQSGKTDSDPANHIRIQSGEQTQIPEKGGPEAQPALALRVLYYYSLCCYIWSPGD